MPADRLTKALTKAGHERFVCQLGLVPYPGATADAARDINTKDTALETAD